MANTTLITKGSTVEVTINEPGFNGAWYVATLVDEVKPSPTGKKGYSNKKGNKTGYLVKYQTLLNEDDMFETLTEVVDPLFVRPSPPRNIRRNNTTDGDGDGNGGGDFEVHDFVDAYHRDGWWIGVVKSVIINDGETTTYVVSFENPTEEFEFDRSKVRLHVDWVDCRWVIPPKKTPEQLLGDRNATDNALSCFATPSKRAQITGIVGLSCSSKKNSRSRERPESNSVVDSSPGKRFQPSTGSKGKNDVIMLDDIQKDTPPVEHEINITQTRDLENGMSHWKRKRRTPPKSVVKKPTSLVEGSSRLSPSNHNGNSPNHVSNGTTTDYQQDWPFIKRSQIWDTIELYSQKPHFAPMKEKREDRREGLAIAHIVTFGNLVQGLSDLKPSDPIDIFNNSLETLCDLETHGFDVGSIRGRYNQLLTLKSKVCEQEDTCKEVEKELEKCNHEKCVVEKEMDELKEKMEVLKSKSEQIATTMKVKEEELIRLQSNDLELDFEILAATPL